MARSISNAPHRKSRTKYWGAGHATSLRQGKLRLFRTFPLVSRDIGGFLLRYQGETGAEALTHGRDLDSIYFPN